ncbi:hypothetical protein [Vibrio owensii]|uniref:hypothetical protein n=1 Tax=Vibrio harveyi group TaxID=717610 RepID=UPI003CC6C20B
MGIQPVEVERIEGCFTHPDLPDWGEFVPNHVLNTWAQQNSIDLEIIHMEDDGEVDEDLVEQWFNWQLSDLSFWSPKPPADNSFMLSIHDTEDGPCVWWATPKPEAGDEQFN